VNFRCSELQGAMHQPKELLEIANCWIIPACKGGPVLAMPDFKLVFVCQEDNRKGNKDLEEYLFVHCYQFLFCRYSDVYWFYSLRRANHPESFVLSGTDISDIETQIRNKYGYQEIPTFSIDFTNIDSDYKTWLPIAVVNFQDFYGQFSALYKKDKEFKEIVTLFCETINGLRPLYNNILQQIAQLHTIFDTIVGIPKTSKCSVCGLDKHVEDWDVFIGKRLKEYGFIDPDVISLIIKIRKTLNKAARVKYVHHSNYYNPRDPRNLIAEFSANEGNSSYTTDIHQVLNKQSNSWKAIDWENILFVYLLLERNLIYLKYFAPVSASTT
jgi:hypothetical protein